MERRSYKAWPTWVPRSFDVDRPTSEYIRQWATIRPEGIAIRYYGLDITYGNLDRMIDRAAWGLIDLGVKKGDRVAVHMQNCPQFVIAYFGAQRVGCVVVPVNPMFKQTELEHELNDAAAETLIGLDFLYSDVEAVRNKTPLKHVILSSLADFAPGKPDLPLPPETLADPRTFPDTHSFRELLAVTKDEPVCQVTDLKEDLAILQYTGGTTGIPKGAMTSHYSLACASMGAAYWYNYRESDVHLAVAPYFHTMGQQQSMCTPLVSGGSIVILSRFVPEVVAAAINQYHCTSWVAATTMIIALLSLPDIKNYDHSSLRCLVTGGAPISTELQSKLQELLPGTLVGEGYGLSETLPQGGSTTPFFRGKKGSVGIPQLNDIRIVDLKTGEKEMAPDEEGEITIKGPTVMKGYWNKPAESDKALRDGWLYTGDIGVMDEEGYIRLKGRKRELIKCSGYSVFPAEVEDLLYRHPAVKEVAVIGISDPYRGETPKAFIILKPEYVNKVKEDEILEWCKENIASYKRPRMVEFRENLPRSAAGKILKRLLA
jgi:acyl-CoA synthetase (AMP-forming)/AMP-acid ligase II